MKKHYFFFLSFIACIQTTVVSQTKIIAHRGYWDVCGSAQNSIQSLVKAQEIEVYGSEVDVHLTKDGFPILFHDSKLNGQLINEFTLAELQNHKLVNGEVVPTLDQFLSQYKQNQTITPILELKPQATKAIEKQLVLKVIERLNKSAVTNEVKFISFSMNICQEIKGQLPNSHVEYLSGDKSPKELKQLGLDGFDYHYQRLLNNPTWIKEAKSLGLSTNSWTVNDETVFKQLEQMGIDFVTTDKPVFFQQKEYLKTQETSITGVVFNDVNQNNQHDQEEQGLAGVNVSNGKRVVTTDKNGFYQLEVDEDDIIFVIKPSGYNFIVDQNNLPQFYHIHKPNGSPKNLKYDGVAPTGISQTVNFGLQKTQKNDDYSILVFGDPQPYTQEQLNYFKQSIIDQVKPLSTTKFGISLGDLVGDDLDLLPPYVSMMKSLNLPWMNVMGNHDMNYDVERDDLSDERFEAIFGPNNYSWNEGDVHFLLLDDILYPDPRDCKGYWAGFRRDQIQFIKNDLAKVDSDKLIVVSMHIPLMEEGNTRFNQHHRNQLLKALKPFKNVLILSAHTHIQQQFYTTTDNGFEQVIHEYNAGTTSGDWYSGAFDEFGTPVSTMRDGTPRGYSFIHFNGNKYVIDYKVYNKPKDYQMSVFVPKAIHQSRTSSRAYVNFFMGSEKSKLYSKIDDREWHLMSKTEDIDYSYLVNNLRWDLQEQLPKGRRPSNAIKSSHIWQTGFPRDLEKGTHTVYFKAVDDFGREFFTQQTFDVQ